MKMLIIILETVSPIEFISMSGGQAHIVNCVRESEEKYVQCVRCRGGGGGGPRDRPPKKKIPAKPLNERF